MKKKHRIRIPEIGYLLIPLFLGAMLLSGCGKTEDTGSTAETAGTILGDEAEGISPQVVSNDVGTVYLYDLGGDLAVTYVRILWKDLEASSYVLEGSTDGQNFTTLYSSDTAPYLAEDLLELGDTAQGQTFRYLRLTENGGGGIEKLEAYEKNPWTEIFAGLSAAIEEQDGRRTVVLSGLPDGITAEFGGCSLEQVIGEDGTICDTIEDKTVQVGWHLTCGDWTVDTPDIEVTVPAQEQENTADRPNVIPALQEWKRENGSFSLTADAVILLPEDDSLREIAEDLQGELLDACGLDLAVSEQDTGTAIRLQVSEETSLGDEGYRMTIGEDGITITGPDATGIFYGTRTLLQMAKTLQDGGACILPRGEIRDYPEYQTRGFEIDAARNFVSLPMLEEIAKNLAYYKMNELTVHLNDNAIFANSSKTDTIEDAWTIDASFRLESDVTGTDGEPLTDETHAYTKEEFASFVQDAAKIGVSVVPEIDTPAHSLAITRIRKDLSLYYFRNNIDAAQMLDLSNPESLEFVKSLWDEELDSAFADCSTLHLGGDEYYGAADDYISYENSLISYLGGTGKKLRIWGSLGNIRGSGRVESSKENPVEMLLWSGQWADPVTMYRAGFSLINSDSGQLYIICGGGYDYLDTKALWDDFEVNTFPALEGSTTLPSWSDRVQGAQYVLWNDMSGELSIGISSYDMFDRFFSALPVLAWKTWGGSSDASYEEFTELSRKTGTAPGSNPYDRPEEATYGEETFEEGTLPALVGPDYEISFEIRADAVKAEDTVLFSAERGTETYEFKISQGITGKVGFSREDDDFVFDYTLPENTWVTLKIRGTKDRTVLYADGKEVSSLGSSDTFTEHATFVFPLEHLGPSGDESSAFEGEIRNINVKTGAALQEETD